MMGEGSRNPRVARRPSDEAKDSSLKDICTEGIADQVEKIGGDAYSNLSAINPFRRLIRSACAKPLGVKGGGLFSLYPLLPVFFLLCTRLHVVPRQVVRTYVQVCSQYNQYEMELTARNAQLNMIIVSWPV